MSDTGANVSETTLRVAADGTVFTGMTASGGAGVMRSLDGGATWTRQTPRVGGKPVLDAAMGWLDLDPRSGRLFASSSGDAACGALSAVSDVVSYSDDQGDTWHTVSGQMCGGGDWGKGFDGPAATAADRKALRASGYQSVVYNCAGATGTVTRLCWKSLNGGRSWQRTGSPAATEFPLLGGSSRLLGDCTEAEGPVPSDFRWPDSDFLAGNGVVAANGTIYMPVNACGFVLVMVSTDDGAHWTARRVTVAEEHGWYPHGDVPGHIVPPDGGLPFRIQEPFHALYGEAGMSALFSQQLAIDRAGNLYLAWVDGRDNKPYLSVSRDHAQTWSRPISLAPSGTVHASETAIAVNSPGQVAVAMYATPGGFGYDGYLIQSEDALNPHPQLETMEVSPTAPIMPNGLSEPTEYLGVAFAPNHTPWASFARDTCVIDLASLLPQCDGNFDYDNTRFEGLVAHIDPLCAEAHTVRIPVRERGARTIAIYVDGRLDRRLGGAAARARRVTVLLPGTPLLRHSIVLKERTPHRATIAQARSARCSA